MTCTIGDNVVEFTKKQEWLDHLAAHKEGTIQPPKPPKEEPEETAAPQEASLKPIVLKYKYEGQCDKCGKEIDTIQIEFLKNIESMMVAYCSNCKIQFVNQSVIPIQAQNTKKSA